jgi:hypothetical protein
MAEKLEGRKIGGQKYWRAEILEGRNIGGQIDWRVDRLEGVRDPLSWVY